MTSHTISMGINVGMGLLPVGWLQKSYNTTVSWRYALFKYE